MAFIEVGGNEMGLLLSFSELSLVQVRDKDFVKCVVLSTNLKLDEAYKGVSNRGGI